ncbi:hypothetical protein DPX16_4141 [Anabarilius grahami]|uniref:Uncharacterized protein n=1 Tax=Anabarilius grahami TaxID=495550 RepID=A0A3N0XYF7_ANAGA|nr:hypothetical protein DPX16_4141 [Anabarilius grahami]
MYAALLNLRNTPRDGMPSPAQRLLSRRTRSLIPMVPSQLTPRVETDVQTALFTLRQKGKISHDKSARRLSPLEPGQTVRMETTRGFDRLATVSGKALQPNSYVVQSHGKTYVRNRRHLLRVTESYCPPTTMSAPMVPPEPQDKPCAALPPNTSTNGDDMSPQQSTDSSRQEDPAPLVITRSGRESKPNSTFKDFVTY